MKKNFIVRPSDARLVMGSLRKAVLASPGVKAVEAADDVPAVKTNKKAGIVGCPAKPAIIGVVGKPAVTAEDQIQHVFIDCKSEEILEEVRARMADLRLLDSNDGYSMVSPNGSPRLIYRATSDKFIRASFKACRSEIYNADGLALEKAAKLALEKTAEPKETPNPKPEPKTKEQPKSFTPDKIKPKVDEDVEDVDADVDKAPHPDGDSWPDDSAFQ